MAENLMDDNSSVQYLTDLSQFLSVIDRVLADRRAKDFDHEAFRADPGWRTRLRDLPFAPEGILNIKTEAGAYDMVAAAIHEARKELHEQQVNGNWEVAGWRIERVPVLRREKLAGVVPREPDRSMVIDGKKHRLPVSVHSGDQVEEGMTQRTRISVVVAFVDMNHGSEIDNWELRTGRKDSPMRDGKLPGRLVQEMASARALILSFVDAEEAAKRLTDEEKGRAHRLAARGVPAAEIADVLGRTEAAVEAALAEPWAAPAEPAPKTRKARA